MESDKFYETLQEFIELGLENGTISDEIFFDWFRDVTEKQLNELMDAVHLNNIEIVCSYKNYLNKIRSKNKKVLFCLYILVCDLLGVYPSPNYFFPRLIIFSKDIVIKILNKNFSKDDVMLCADIYGLDDGIYCLNFDDFVEKFEIDSEVIYEKSLIQRYYYINKVIQNIKKNDKNIHKLADIFHALSINKFTLEEISSGDVKYLMYTPNMGKDMDFGPFIEKSLDNLEKGIGWLKEEGEIAHEFTIKENNEWILRLYNLLDKPNPIVKYQNNKLLFSLSYGKNGYNGYQFVFEKNENIKIRILEKNTLLKETAIPYKFIGNICGAFYSNDFNESNGDIRNVTRSEYRIRNNPNDNGLFYEYSLNEYNEINLAEIHDNKHIFFKTTYSIDGDFYGYLISNKNRDEYMQFCIDDYDKAPIISVNLTSDSPYIYVLKYNPSDLSSPMKLLKLDANHNTIDCVDVLKEYLEELGSKN